jgi:hypothetical protein
MRSGVAVAALLLAVLVPELGNAQGVSVGPADWQQRGEPLLYAGDAYFPTGPTVFLDRDVMVPAGSYRGVPLFIDPTLEPYSVVYAPIGGDQLRPYERRRAGELEGTVGSRTPSFPVQDDVEVSTDAPRIDPGSASEPRHLDPVRRGAMVSGGQRDPLRGTPVRRDRRVPRLSGVPRRARCLGDLHPVGGRRPARALPQMRYPYTLDSTIGP